ncbi:transglycosylase SLT domain-containing protein [Streptomyces sp. NPDC087658]|uniref:transglycosylase SLT domain-containing protein n=1 Tax=Streptomyces sp. NPDC087658 TaxID=3365800 RepID=UPI003825DEB6
MPTKAKHRRTGAGPLARRLVAAGAGGAVVLALPLMAATTAHAAPSAQSAAAKSVPTVTTVVQKATTATYSVVVGDSLSRIAAAHSLSGGWKKLYENNRTVIGGNPELIKPGLQLALAGKAATAAKPAAAPAAAKTYANNLDGWIRESLDIMAARGIPGTYNGLYRNIIRESSGNPRAINLWDSNAAAGIPSKGLLQVIDPTFRAYHVPGTSFDSYDPVANITAAANYAAARYGSIDNVNGPY